MEKNETNLTPVVIRFQENLERGENSLMSSLEDKEGRNCNFSLLTQAHTHHHKYPHAHTLIYAHTPAPEHHRRREQTEQTELEPPTKGQEIGPGMIHDGALGLGQPLHPPTPTQPSYEL